MRLLTLAFTRGTAKQRTCNSKLANTHATRYYFSIGESSTHLFDSRCWMFPREGILLTLELIKSARVQNQIINPNIDKTRTTAINPGILFYGTINIGKARTTDVLTSKFCFRPVANLSSRPTARENSPKRRDPWYTHRRFCFALRVQHTAPRATLRQ